ncbi:MAG: 4'-phosphopantetheinyl transferase superfamily protein [Clostridia bacterium]|nr:4'-phosphopantetheinyl transferase superfamily protein [Clostridia bacterium]MBQ3869727.1 4'-phosphopantetheinyl transferase superfamily protein [Clostridia bacterium]
MIRLYHKTLLSEKDGRRAGKELLTRACAEAGVDYGSEPKYKNSRGKEYFKNAPLFYNVSHTKNLVCAAVSDTEVGVDCETVRDIPDHMKIAKRFFTRREFEEIEQSGDTLYAFLTVWTKKESFIKQTGEGFATPLSSFDVRELSARQKTFETNGAIVTVTGDGAADTIIINGDTI